MDLVEGLTMSNGKCANFVVINSLSKYAHFIPHPYSYISIGVARFFFLLHFQVAMAYQNLFCVIKILLLLVFWKELFCLNGTSFNFSSSYHPQTYGQSEMVNQTFEMYLRCFTSSRQKEWMKWLSWAEYCYNASWNLTINKTPFEVVYG